MSDLPFTCPACGEQFGFGPSGALTRVVTDLPFTDEPTPCCGYRITGSLVRTGDRVEMLLEAQQ